MKTTSAAKLTLNKNKSMIVSNRQSLAKRVQRILRANDLHIPVADATRTWVLMQQVGPGDDAVRETRDSERQGGEVVG